MQGHSGRRAAICFRVAGFVLLAAYLAFVLWLTLRPMSEPWVAAPARGPLATIRADLALDPWHATRSLGGGLLLLAPLGVLLPLSGGGVEVSGLVSLVRTTFTGAMVSLVLEVGHSAVTGQVVSLDQVVLNTVGVTLAHLAVVPAVRARIRRRRLRRRTPAVPQEQEEGAVPVAPTMSGAGIAR